MGQKHSFVVESTDQDHWGHGSPLSSPQGLDLHPKVITSDSKVTAKDLDIKTLYKLVWEKKSSGIKNSPEKKREREKKKNSSTCWFITQMPPVARATSVQRQGHRTPSRSQVTWTITSCPLGCSLAGSRIRRKGHADLLLEHPKKSLCVVLQHSFL